MGRLLLLACSLLCVMYADAARSNAANIPSARGAAKPVSSAGAIRRLPSRPAALPPFIPAARRRVIPIARQPQTIITGNGIRPIKVTGRRLPIRPQVLPVAPVLPAVSTGTRATPRRVASSEARSRVAAGSSASSARHASVRSSSQARVAQETSRRAAFSAPSRTGQAALSRQQFSQGGKVVPFRSVSRGKGRVTQNGVPVAILITDFYVIINGEVFFIDQATSTIWMNGQQFVVCGFTIAPATIFICCGDQLLLRFDPDTLAEIQCCGAEFFFPATEICCDGFFAPRQIGGFATACCASDIFFPSDQICCQGAIWETGNPSIPVSVLSCCGDTAYDRRFSTCCNGFVSDIGSAGSCGCANPNFFICCDGVLSPRGVNNDCCGTTAINTQFQQCCFGVPVSRFVNCNFNPAPPNPPHDPHPPYYAGYSAYKKK